MSNQRRAGKVRREQRSALFTYPGDRQAESCSPAGDPVGASLQRPNHRRFGAGEVPVVSCAALARSDRGKRFNSIENSFTAGTGNASWMPSFS